MVREWGEEMRDERASVVVAGCKCAICLFTVRSKQGMHFALRTRHARVLHFCLYRSGGVFRSLHELSMHSEREERREGREERGEIGRQRKDGRRRAVICRAKRLLTGK